MKGTEGGLSQFLGIAQSEREGAFRPGKEAVDDLLHLLLDGGLDGIARDVEPVGQNVAEAPILALALLNLDSLLQGVEVDQLLAQQKFAKVFAAARGIGADHLTVVKIDLSLAPVGLQRQDSGLAAQADDLKDFPQAEIFKVSNKTHINQSILVKRLGLVQQRVKAWN